MFDNQTIHQSNAKPGVNRHIRRGYNLLMLIGVLGIFQPISGFRQ
jgi:hypothetical protein